jgi:hypothetical protein
MRKHKKLAHWDDERSDGNSLIVTLTPGWRYAFDSMPTHVGGFDTAKEAMSAVRSAVRCSCQDCRRELAVLQAARPQPAAPAAST